MDLPKLSFQTALVLQERQVLLHRNVQRFQGGLVFKAHRLLCHSTLALRVIKKKKKDPVLGSWVQGLAVGD